MGDFVTHVVTKLHTAFSFSYEKPKVKYVLEKTNIVAVFLLYRPAFQMI